MARPSILAAVRVGMRWCVVVCGAGLMRPRAMACWMWGCMVDFECLMFDVCLGGASSEAMRGWVR